MSLILVFLLVLFAAAAPIDEAKRGSSGVSTSLLATFNLMEQYAAAAYCASDDHSGSDAKITCSTGNCPLVQAANTNSVCEFESTTSTDVTVYVSIDHTNQLVVVAFRGSISIDNWITNINLAQVSTDICKGCTAHGGFWQSWVDARTDVLAAVKNASDTYSNYQLVSTGHSLGGAIASIAAAELRNSGYIAALYTFGAPRIASATLSNYITNQPGGNYRVTHYNDIVPRLPPTLLNYVHISPEYYINKPNSKAVAATDVKIYTGDNNKSGNGAWLLTDISAHLWYFNSICACSATNVLGKRDVEGLNPDLNKVSSL